MNLIMKDIKYSGLDTKIIKNLKFEKINTLEDLLKLSSSDILKIPGIGKESLKKIENLKEVNECIETNKNYEIINNMIKQSLNEIKSEIKNVLFHNINEIRTLILEQSRILEAIQSINRPDGIINKISEKIPGFNNVIYDLYKKINDN